MSRVLLAGVAVTLGLLSGCSDDADPSPMVSPTPSSSSAGSTSPSHAPTPAGPVEPTLPPEAEGDDAAAAEAFVRHYWEMVNYAQATGDVAGLRRLESPTCEACAGGRRTIEETYGAGGSIEGGEARVSSAQAGRLGTAVGRVFGVTVEVDIAEQVVNEPGAETVRHDGGTFTFDFIVQNERGSLLVARWDVDL
ncbi:DUF6318 family protein [Nocardioides dongkuii]|uniref:DUF6318 family protein n=1 Tax=Nocardioides dongkuii TaxID=2760089 RepID=UPI001878061B|nr:DUF6318 family protein [Nocardioides dongkuii]